MFYSKVRNYIKKNASPELWLYSSIFTYFLFPYTFAALHFSPHTLLLGLCLISALLVNEGHFFLAKEKVFLISILLILIVKFLFVPSTISSNLQPMAISFIFFLLTRKYFCLIKEEMLIKFILIIIFLQIFLTFGQVLIGEAFYVYKNFSGPSSAIYAVGLGNYSNLSSLLMVPFITFFVIWSVKSKNFYYFIISVAASASIYFTMSRAGWLALFLTFLSHLILNKDKKVFIKSLIIISFSFFLAYSLKTNVSNYAPGGSEAEGRWNLTDYSSRTRIATFNVGIKSIQNNVFFGVGSFENFYSEQFDSIPDNDLIDQRRFINPHNSYIQIAAENGLVFTIIFFSYIGYLFKRILLFPGPYQKILLPYLIGIMAFFVFHDGFHERVFWILLGILSSHSFRKIHDR